MFTGHPEQQQGGVEYDRDRARIVYQCPRCRTESPPDGEQNRRKVQQQGKGEIQADDMHHVAGKAQQKGKETDFIVDQNYIS